MVKPGVPGKPGKPGKLGSVLRRRAALGPVAKAGIAVVVIAFVVAGIFFYKIFFPPPAKEEPIVLQIVKRPPPVKDNKDDAAAQAAKLLEATKAAEKAAEAKRIAEQAKADAAALAAVTPVPVIESVMAPSNITTDVKVNITHLNAAPAASPAFRTFVAGASIGGVFQGYPSRALINGTIVREGQVVEGALSITFDRIDAVQKMIYFKDATGAEVSKSY